MKLYRRQSNRTKPVTVPPAYETFSSLKSLDAVREMFLSEDHQAARKSYSAALVKESQDLGAYIVRKRTSTKRKDEPELARSA